MNRVEVWNDLGNIYLKANDMNAAIDAYQRAIEQGDVNSDVYKNLAAAYFNQGNIRDSIPLYQKSIELLSDLEEKAIIYTYLGDCYRRVEDFDNAIASFKSAIELQPGNPELCAGLSEVQRDLEKIFGFDNVTDSEQGKKDGIAANTGSPAEAAGFDPDLQAPISGGLTMANRRNGNSFTSQLPASLISESITISNDLVHTISAEKDQGTPIVFTPTSEHAGELISSIASDFIPVNLETAEAYGTKSESGSAKTDEKQESEHGVRLTLLLTLGIMQYRNANLEEADSILQSAINSSVEIGNTWFEALAWHAIALVKTALGELESAIHAYLRAVELAPDQIFPWNNLGSLYENVGENEKALDAYQKAIKINPDDATSWDGMGDVYTKMCRFDEAIAAYQLANVFERKPKGEEAIKNYEKAFEFYNYTLSSFENAKKVILKATETYQPESMDDTGSLGLSVKLDLVDTVVPVIEIKSEAAEEQSEKKHVPSDDVVIEQADEQNSKFCSVESSILVETAPEMEQLVDELRSGQAEMEIESITESINPAEADNSDNADAMQIETPVSLEIDLEVPCETQAVVETMVNEDRVEIEGAAFVENLDDYTPEAVIENEMPVQSELEAGFAENDETAELVYEDTIDGYEAALESADQFESQLDTAQLQEMNDAMFDGDLTSDLSSDTHSISELELSSAEETIMSVVQGSQLAAEEDSLIVEILVTKFEEETSVEIENLDIETEAVTGKLEVLDRAEEAEAEAGSIFMEFEPAGMIVEPLLSKGVEPQYQELTAEDVPAEELPAIEIEAAIENKIDIQEYDGETVVIENSQDVLQEEDEIIGNSENKGKFEGVITEEEVLPPVVVIVSAPVKAAENLEHTIATYEATVKQNPKNDRAWRKLGAAYLATEQYTDAVSAYEKAVTLKPRNHVYHFELGTVLAASGNLESAVGEIEKVLELDPEFMAAHCTLAGYFRKLDNETEAKKHLDAVAAYMNNEKEYDRACFESICGNVETALELLNTAIEKKQTNIEAISRDQDLDFIRNDQRYLDFIDQHNN